MNKTRRPRPQLFLLLAILALISAALLLSTSDRFKHAPRLPEPPLKELAAAKGIQVGSFIAYNYVTERPYRDIITGQFEYAIVDGQPNWSFEDGDLQPGPDQYDFSRLDRMVRFAEERGMPIRMQHYVWGEKRWLPAW